MNKNQAENPYTEVSVRAPARLHLGFLDLNATIGRKFGSIGLAIDSHYTHIRLHRAEQTQLYNCHSEESSSKILAALDRFYQTIGQHIPEAQRSVSIELVETIPEHAGLGSGTQLVLVLGAALAKLHGINTNSSELASALGRGHRSGIGIATFSNGGFIVDGGLAPSQTVPPMLMQHPFPEDWRIVMIMAPHHTGIHGQNEKQAFKTLPLFPLQNAQAICHLTLMQLLPAMLEKDLNTFGDAVTKIQALIGDHFAPMQGGRYSSDAVAACLLHAQALGHSGIAQSSWGPTGCVFVDSDSAADELISQLNTYTKEHVSEPLTLIKVQASNTGAIIETNTKVPL